MKNNLEVEKSKINRGLNLLARQIVDQEFTPEMVAMHIEEKFGSVSKKERMVLLREVINRSCSYAWTVPISAHQNRVKNKIIHIMPLEKIIPFVNELKKCVAVNIARHLIEELRAFFKGKITKKPFGSYFYSHCLSRFRKYDAFSQIEDGELWEIYFKQMGHLIRETSIIEEDIAINSDHESSIANLFSELFIAFWGKVPWEEIFPSNPAAARELSKIKSILIDLLVQQKGKFNIRNLANEFFSLTGFSDLNDMYMISFLDFYFFTWLSHFGILAYCRPIPEVCLKITPFGKEFLKYLREYF
ncbi:MAG: hypothetical protein N2316_04840 [Spirochaetes bacterium]|nr:hypothetical protein [Spirochaetota bacterium]